MRHRHRRRAHRRHRPPRCRDGVAGAARGLPCGPRPGRDPPAPGQDLHPGPLPGRRGHGPGGRTPDQRRQAGLHARGRLRPRAPHAGALHRLGHHPHPHPCRGGPRHRPARVRGRAGAGARPRRLGGPGAVRVPAGGPDRQPRHGGAAGGGPAPRRPRHRRRALLRRGPARADRPHLRPGARLGRGHRHAPGHGRHHGRDAGRVRLPQDGRIRLGRARRGRARHADVPAGPSALRRAGGHPGARRGGGDGAAGHRPVPDGAPARPLRAPRRRPRRAAAGGGGQLLGLHEQRAQPVHALWRRQPAADGQPVCQRLPRRAPGGAAGLPGHGDGPRRPAAARRGLRHPHGRPGGPGGAGRRHAGRRGGGDRAAAVGPEGRAPHLHAGAARPPPPHPCHPATCHACHPATCHPAT